MFHKEQHTANSETNSQQSVAFPRLRDAEIAALKRTGTTRHLPAGEPLFEVGVLESPFFVVLSGALEIVDRSGDKPRTIHVHQPGEFTGSLGVLRHWRSIAGALGQ